MEKSLRNRSDKASTEHCLWYVVFSIFFKRYPFAFICIKHFWTDIQRPKNYVTGEGNGVALERKGDPF